MLKRVRPLSPNSNIEPITLNSNNNQQDEVEPEMVVEVEIWLGRITDLSNQSLMQNIRN